jgi:hypothetical protein
MPQVTMLDSFGDTDLDAWFAQQIGRIASALEPHLAG